MNKKLTLHNTDFYKNLILKLNFIHTTNIDINENDISKYRFIFIGELGYGIVSWFPYLNFLNSKGINFKTLMIKGYKSFCPFISSKSDHVEVELKHLDSWGTFKQLMSEADAKLSAELCAAMIDGLWLRAVLSKSDEDQFEHCEQLAKGYVNSLIKHYVA